MSTAIECSNVTKSYAEKTVLDDISYKINPGELVGLVGVNGAGKTTMIKSILDLTDINSGTINLFGVDHTCTDARSELAYLPERFNPPSFLKGSEFITYMLELHQAEEKQSRVHAVMEELDFDPADLAKPIHAYSKGMVQKIGLATSLLSNKPLLILDEPMSGLDPKARKHLKEVFSRLKQKEVTLFISTHLLADAALICNRLFVLHNAGIVFDGSPNQFLEMYASTDFDEAFVNCISAN